MSSSTEVDAERQLVEKHVKTGVKWSANKPTAQTNDGKACLFNSSQKELQQSRERHTHTHPRTLNTQTHVISPLNRGNTHTPWKSFFSAGLTATPSVVTVTHRLQSLSAFQSYWQANNESQQGHHHQHNNPYYHHFLLGTTDKSKRHIFRNKRIQKSIIYIVTWTLHQPNMQHWEATVRKTSQKKKEKE